MIATLAESACAARARVVIVSADKDLCELVRADGAAALAAPLERLAWRGAIAPPSTRSTAVSGGAGSQRG